MSNSKPMSHLLRKPEFFTVLLYFLTFVLVVTPYYNWFYRITINLLHLFTLSVALLVIFLGLVPRYFFKRAFRNGLLTGVVGLTIFFAGSQARNLRYHITNSYLQSMYCSADRAISGNLVLGGIRQIQGASLKGGTAFVNDSHCLTVVCSEEFYTCSH